MFRAVNTEKEMSQIETVREKRVLESEYSKALKSGKIEDFMQMSVKYESNRPILENGRSNLLEKFVLEAPVEEIEAKIEEYGIMKSMYPTFSLIQRYIVEKRYVKAKKMINLAKLNGWACGELYRLEDELMSRAYGRWTYVRKRIWRKLPVSDYFGDLSHLQDFFSSHQTSKDNLERHIAGIERHR